MEGCWVVPSMFRKVKRAIAAGDILVRCNPASSSGGAYQYQRDLFEFRFSRAKSVNEKALVVHESVHAAQDIKGRPIKLTIAEAASYLAQMVYARSILHSKPAFGPRDRVFEIAWDLAEKVLNNKPLSVADQYRLRNAVHANPTYSGHQHGEEHKFDGLR
jgi:hypothetical protein